MKKIKPTQKTLRKLIADEKKASKMYKSYGFGRLGKDEARHRKFLVKKLKKIKR